MSLPNSTSNSPAAMPTDQEPPGFYLVRSPPADTASFDAYCAGLEKLRDAYGGEYLVRSKGIATPTHPGPRYRLTVLKFAALSDLQRLLDSPEHAALFREIGPDGVGRAWAMPGLMPQPEPLAPSTTRLAYCVTRTTVKDAALLERYQPLVAQVVKSHGGRYFVRTDEVQIVTGVTDPYDPSRFVLLEYPSRERLQAALTSPDMDDMRKYWDRVGRIELWVAEGVSS